MRFDPRPLVRRMMMHVVFQLFLFVVLATAIVFGLWLSTERNASMFDTAKWVKEEIEKIEKDAVYQEEPALTKENAPYIMRQVHLKSRLKVLKELDERLDYRKKVPAWVPGSTKE